MRGAWAGAVRRLLSSKVGVIVLTATLAGAFGGTVVYAATNITSPELDGSIHACYDKGGKGAGKIRLVEPGTQCKNSELPIQWNSLNTFEQMEGTPCTFEDELGAIEVTYDGSGFAKLRCVIPPQSCSIAADCPLPANECEERACIANVCGTAHSPPGTSCAGGTCDGSGACVPDAVCGDGVEQGAEACDDGNTVTETSCSYGTANCTACSASCDQENELTGPYCGDGITQPGIEQCDDGFDQIGDGCDSACQIESGWECTGEPSVCQPI